jgi:hypothetical protein
MMIGDAPLLAVDGQIPFKGIRGNIKIPDLSNKERELLSGENKLASELGKLEPNPADFKELLTKGVATAGIEAGGQFLGLPPFATTGLLAATTTYFKPEALINGFATLQKKNIQTQKLTSAFANALTRNPSIANTATKEILTGELKKAIFSDTANAPSLTLDNTEARKLYAWDKSLIERLSGPDAIDQIENRLGSKYEEQRLTFPTIADKTIPLLGQQAGFLKKKFDEVFRPKGDNLAGYKTIEPTSQQLFTYGLYSRYVHYPNTAQYDILKKNYVPDAAIEVLQQLYPAKFDELKNTILNTLLESRQNGEVLSPNQRRMLHKLLGKDANEFTTDQIKVIQSTFSQESGNGRSGNVGDRSNLEKEGTTLGK